MKVKYSALVSGASGKLNGSVASRNKGGDYFRTKVTPVNPKTSYQTLQRARLGTLSSAWQNTLTAAQRASWVAYGKLIGQLNIFGDNLILSGIATFIKVNQIILTAGGSMVTSAPATNTCNSLTSLVIVANHTGPVLTLTTAPTPLVAPQGLYVFATPPISPGVTNFNNQLRFLKWYSAFASAASIATEWVARFGSFPTAAGQRIGVKAFVADDTTGALSAAILSSTVII